MAERTYFEQVPVEKVLKVGKVDIPKSKQRSTRSKQRQTANATSKDTRTEPKS